MNNMYTYFQDFCGITDEMLAQSPTLQKCLVAGSMGLACFGIVAICYMLIVIFRGWK